MSTAQIVSCIECDGPVRPDSRLYNVKAVLDGVIEFVTPGSVLPVQRPAPLEESSLLESSMGEVEVSQLTVTYEIVEEGTKRRKQKLIDSLGYSYNIKEREKASTYWQCTVRPKENYCKATVRHFS